MLENTPDGRVVSLLSWRSEEQMKMKMRERNGRKEQSDCQDLQKHLRGERTVCCYKDSRVKSENDKKQTLKRKQERKTVNVREDTRRKCGQMVTTESSGTGMKRTC